MRAILISISALVALAGCEGPALTAEQSAAAIKACTDAGLVPMMRRSGWNGDIYAYQCVPKGQKP